MGVAGRSGGFYPAPGTVNRPANPTFGFPGIVAVFTQALPVGQRGFATIGPSNDVVDMPDRCITPGTGARSVPGHDHAAQTVGELASLRIHAQQLSGTRSGIKAANPNILYTSDLERFQPR